MNGARFIRNDLSLVVEELLEEQEEHAQALRRRGPPCRSSSSPTSTSPTARSRCSSASTSRCSRARRVALARHQRCGQVDHPAGDQRARGARAGRGAPQRPEHHLRDARGAGQDLGIMQLPGGQGVFGDLTVDQNLAVSARLNAGRRPGTSQRVDARLRAVPRARRPAATRSRRACRAASSRCWRWLGC